MGVDTETDLLTWDQIEPHSDKLRMAALDQMIDTWRSTHANTSEGVCWGDEVEYQIIKLHPESKEAHLCLQQGEILRKADSDRVNTTFEWQPEFARFMAESNPTRPFTLQPESLADVHQSMLRRRRELKSLLVDDADPYTFTLFPLLGSKSNQYDQKEQGHDDSPENESSRFVPDSVISPKKRYLFLEANARVRAGKSMIMKMPIFYDEKTPSPWRDPSVKDDEVSDGNIFLEGTIFGPGACGLQVTMEAKDLDEACEIHDQLCALGPVMLAMTANTPIFKGFLADTDARWNTISQSFDDRKREERGVIAPRWSPCPMYLGPSCSAKLAQSTLPADKSIRDRLEGVGIPPPLAHFYAHFFKRSILLVSGDDVTDPITPSEPDLWTRLSGTVFPHVRLKMPQGSEGWRVEFRPMEVQFTDFENASCAIFVSLFRQAVVHYKLDFRIAIDKVHADIDKAHARNACSEKLFWWRQLRSKTVNSATLLTTDDEPCMLSVNEIINGTPDETDGLEQCGLLHLVKCFISENQNFDAYYQGTSYRDVLFKHLGFIANRASGIIPTGAHFTRSLVRSHPDYQRDSVVTPSICYDLAKQVKLLVETDLDSISDQKLSVST